MNQELWRRVKTIAADAWDRPPADRASYVARTCGSDALLHQEVFTLLEAMEQARERFETPALAAPAAGLAATKAIETHRSPLIGEHIGPWRLVRELGHGGMGTVYLAERTGAEFVQRVAVKVVRGGASDRVLLRRFREERRILATLEHPHIARLIDGDATPLGLPYVVLEYVDGVPIDVYCERHRLDLRQRIVLFQQVGSAVEYAHRRLIVHRDIKPSNILVTVDGAPKLLDFGIAKILEADGTSDATALRMITPESASPEQVRGEPVTTATDVYALGVLLYRLLTSQLPYRLASESQSHLIQAICEQAPVPPSTVVPEIDSDLDHIILKSLRKEPERRYGSAEQLSADLQRYLDGRPVLATPDSRTYRMRKFVGRHRLGVAATVALVAAIAAGAGATMWQARVAERQRARAEQQFNAVRTLASSVLGELHDAVSQLAGSTGARELLLRRATEYLDGLAREAGDDITLRRELAAGYRRLAEVQGATGVSNVGDREAALVSYRKALALLESLAERPGELGDRIRLAGNYVSLANLERQLDVRQSLNRRAVTLLESLPAAAHATPEALNAAVRVWHSTGRVQISAKDYAGANASFTNEVSAAERALKLDPENRISSRNLSLALQQLGTSFEMLGRPDDAIATYRRALDIDRQRVARFGSDAASRLDLSFSHGALGAAFLSRGDIQSARDEYQRALELRRAVVADDPENDWARDALAYAYQRLALVQARSGDVEGGIASHEQRLAVLRQRTAAHPDRDRPWIDYARALLESATECAEWLEASPVSVRVRGRLAARIDGMLDELVRLRARWVRERRQGVLPSPDDELQRARARVHRLLTPPATRRSGSSPR